MSKNTNTNISSTDASSAGKARSQPQQQPQQQQMEFKRQVILNPETQRKCAMAQMYFLDYYYDLLTYLHQRKVRTEKFKEDVKSRNLTPDQAQKEWKYYTGKERAYLRKRRTRTNAKQFQILTQVGQGGYGQVCDVVF
ncbi:hypothetical protein BKA69DRAFT_1092265 [Paraphysoderma sedebokerense]|nr:hypothetical protein BKA69DRAFT_1092265 [Paraphysoderma sedebokerense]